MHAPRRTLLVLLLFGVACGSEQPSGPEPIPEPESVRAQIILSDTRRFAMVPDSVRVGEDFEVMVRSWAGHTGWTIDRTDVEYPGGSRVVVSPYNFTGPGGGGFMIIEIDHRATLRFDSPGLKTIIFRGRGWSDNVVAFSRRVRVVDG